MTTETQVQTTQVYHIVIKATPDDIWDAITKPEFTQRYFHGARITVVPDHYSSLGPEDEVWGDEPVYEFDPPRKLVHGWRSRYSPEAKAESESRVTWQITPQDDGTCALTVTHDKLEGAPITAASVAGLGWMSVLSGLKTLLETGKPLV